MSNGVCNACRRSIDAHAKLCPFCGADPATGERVDTQALLQEVFSPREVSATESVMEYARHRQGIVIAVAGVVIFLLLAGLHQFVTRRNASAVSSSSAVPLTEITDLANRPDETKPLPIPDLDFQYEGRPQAMRTYIVESGAIAPAPPPGATTTTGTPGPAPAATPGPAPAAAPPRAR
jgi:hypothetical protein